MLGGVFHPIISHLVDEHFKLDVLVHLVSSRYSLVQLDQSLVVIILQK